MDETSREDLIRHFAEMVTTMRKFDASFQDTADSVRRLGPVVAELDLRFGVGGWEGEADRQTRQEPGV
jgi:hypothetical protein